MIANAVERLLPEMAEKTLGTMFFTMPDSVSRDAGRPAGELIAASLTFHSLTSRSLTSHGSSAGRFGLIVSYAAAKELASNFLGRDEPERLTRGHVTSVIGELANMICGAVLSEMEFDASFALSSPEAVHLGVNEVGPGFTSNSPSVCRFEFPGGGALVLFLAFEAPV